MDILSFVLGIVMVVIIGLSIIAVIGFVKARKIEKELTHFTANIYQTFDRNEQLVHRRVDELENNLQSQLDSRLDKLESKLTTKK